jgi:Enoyl-CoA hydratase/isomerase
VDVEVRGAAEVADQAASPLAADLLDDVVVVDLEGARLTGDQRAALAAAPAVVVGVTAAPDGEPPVDVAVADGDAAARVVAAVEACPVAAVSLVLLLRASESLPVDAALVAESATYSTLQAGPEHRRWLDATAARRADRSPQRAGRSADAGERVRVAREGARLHVALARPEARNAVDAAMQRALVDALAAAGPEDEVLLTGDGPVFSAGGDLDEFGSLADPASAHVLRLRRSPARALARVAGRTTVVVQGACHGAGVELPAFARRVVARPGTTFTLPEVGMGLVPGAGGTVSIPRRIGRRRTAWLALTGEPLDTPTALDWGLVDEIADD